MTTQNISSLEIREKIVSKAHDLFWHRGIKSVTMDEIAKELGMSKKTLYLHFKNKNELVYQCTKNEIDAMQKHIMQASGEKQDALSRFIEIAEYFKTNLIQFNPLLVYDMQRFHPKAWQLFLNHKEEFAMTCLTKILYQGIEEGVFRPELNPEIVVKVRFEQVQMIYNPMIFPYHKYDIHLIQLQILDMFIYGIVTPKGYTIFTDYQKTKQALQK